CVFFFQAEDGIRDFHVTGVQTCALPILEAAATLPRPGGLLIYSTCSLEPEENEAQVDWFLDRHPEYAIRPPAGFDPALLDARGRLTVLPQRTGVDGAFAARMERRA